MSKRLGLDLKKEGRELDVRLFKQWNKKDCVMTSELIVIDYKTGKVMNEGDVRRQAVDQEAATDTYGVKNANKLAEIGGLKGEILNTYRGSGDDLLKSMIEQLENNNPVMIVTQDSKGNFYHMEVASGYDFDSDGQLRILLLDPGFQGDRYLDTGNMQPYQDDEGKKDYSGIFNDWGYEIESTRRVYGFNYYDKYKQKNKK